MAASEAPPSLWWTSNGAVLAALQNHDPSAPAGTQKLLDGHYDWILNGTLSFHQPSESSRKLLQEPFVTFKGKKFQIQGLLRPATLKLSLLLDLDELQAHILLKRWMKDTGQEHVLENAVPGTQIGFGLDVMLQVLSYYHDERLMLLKCIQYVLLQGVQEPVFATFCERLIKAGIEDKVFAALRANMDSGGPASGAYAAATAVVATGTIVGRLAAVMKEFGSSGNMAWFSAVHGCLREQLQRERGELLSILLLLYELPAPQPRPGGAAAAAGPRLRCSSHRVLELVSMLGGTVFPRSTARPRGEGQQDDREAVPDVPPPPASSPSTEVAEQMGCLLLLSVLDLPAYIHLTSAPPPGPAAPMSLDGLVPLGGKVRDLHNELRGWAGTPTNAALLLTWSAIVKLLEPYLDLGESSVEDLQARTFAAGGFGAIASCLQQHAALVSGAFGRLHRGILLKALCLTSTAFDLGPSRLPHDTFCQLLALLHALVAGDARTCALVWDTDLDLTEPLRAILRDTIALFPADVSMTVGLLSALSEGPAAASAAYAFLASQPRLAVMHDAAADAAALQPLGGEGGEGGVVLARALPWNQAPSVATMVLPEGVEGVELPMPAALSHLEGQGKRLVVWDVRGTHRSFGQLLLLGRCAHCVHLLERALHTRGAVDGAVLRDLQGSIELLAVLCGHQPGLVPDLMSLTVDLTSGDKVTWLDVAAAAASVLVQLEGAGISTGAVAPCLQLLRHLARFHPTKVLSAVQRIAMLFPTSLPEGLSAEPGQQLPAIPLSALPTRAPEAGPSIYQGLLPGFRAFQQEVGAREGRHPELLAFLDLVAELLHAGHVGGPMAAWVCYVLHELLPSHHLMACRVPEARWEVTAAALKVLRLAIEAGAHMAPPPPPPSASPSSSAAPSPPPSPSGGRWELHVSPLGAHVLSTLLLHGPALLAPCLPPTAPELESLRAGDPSAPALGFFESTAGELLRLLPRLASAARPYPHELPIEEFLFFSHTPSGCPPAALLVTYLSYMQPDATSPETTLSYLALKGLQALQACVARPVARSLMAGLSMALVVARGGPAQEALRGLFRPDAACAQPDHFLLAVEVLEGAVQDSAELLDCMLFPCALEEQSAPASASERTPAPAGAAGALAVAAAPPASAPGAAAVIPLLTAPAPETAKKKAAPVGGPPPFSALDGLAQLLERAAAGDASASGSVPDEVLCCALRAAATLWQSQGGAPWPAHLLRTAPGAGLWGAIDACLGLSARTTPAANPPPRSQDSPWLRLAQAYAWQILMQEAYLFPRPPAGAAPTEASASTAKVWGLLDRAIETGALVAALRRCRSVLAADGDRRLLQRAVLLLQATYLELGACCLGGVLGEGSSHEDTLPVSGLIRDELRSLREQAEPLLLGSRGTSGDHLLHHFAGDTGGVVGHAHACLLAAAARLEDGVEGAAAVATGLLASGNPLVELLMRRPMGRTLLGFCCPLSDLTMEAVCYGPGYLLNGQRLSTLLGPLTEQLASADALAAALADLGAAASLASARLAALQAACGLAAVLPARDARCAAALQAQAAAAAAAAAGAGGAAAAAPVADATPGTPGTSGSGAPVSLLDAALEAATASVHLLLSWSSDPAGAAQADWPTGALLQYATEAAVCACRFLLHSLTALKGPPAAAAVAPPLQGTAGVGQVTPQLQLAVFPYGAPRQAPVPEARTLFPATPPAKSGRPGGSGVSPSASPPGGAAVSQAAGGAAAAAALAACLPLCTLLGAWLRAAASGGLAAVQPAALRQVTDMLASAALLVLQLARVPLFGGSATAAPSAELRLVQLAVLDALPHLCRLCAADAVSLPIGMQIVAEAVGRLLSPEDWLPVLAAQLDVMELVVQTARTAVAAQERAVGSGGGAVAGGPMGSWGGAAQAAAGDMGLLQLALLVAQTSEGAHMLYEQGALDKLAALTRHLLSARGGGLAPFTALEFPGAAAGRASGWGDTTAPVMSTRPFLPPAADAAATSSGPAAAAPAAQHVDLAYAYLPPATPGGPAPWNPSHQQWCLLLSFSAVLVRTLSAHVDVEQAAIELLVASEPRLLLSCVPPSGSAVQPLTLASLFEMERSLFLLSHLVRFSGSWHVALPGSLARFRTAASAFVAFAALPNTSKGFGVCCPPQSAPERAMAMQPTGLPRTEGWFRACSMGAVSAAPAGAAQAAAAAQQPPLAGHCSEYSGRMAELMYTCLYHALSFLLASSPQLGEGEAASLGPMWPRTRDLAALQDQCMAVLYSMSDVPRVGGGVEGGGRRKHLCQGVLKVLQLLADFLDAMGYPSGRRDAERTMREQLLAVEAALTTGELLPRPLAPLLPLSPAVSLGSSLLVN